MSKKVKEPAELETVGRALSSSEAAIDFARPFLQQYLRTNRIAERPAHWHLNLGVLQFFLLKPTMLQTSTDPNTCDFCR